MGDIIRMVVENGQWKIDWLTHEYVGLHTLLHLPNYKTSAERIAEDSRKAEAASKAEAELFRLDKPRPLAVGGGEAGKAYLEFCNAEKANGKATYLKFVTGKQAEFFSQPDKATGRGGYAWVDNSAVDYPNLNVLGGMTAGNKVVLNVSSALAYPYLNYEVRRSDTGKVLMMNEGGQWKVIKQVWKYGKTTTVKKK
jgi:hypothetical protein